MFSDGFFLCYSFQHLPVPASAVSAPPPFSFSASPVADSGRESDNGILSPSFFSSPSPPSSSLPLASSHTQRPAQSPPSSRRPNTRVQYDDDQEQDERRNRRFQQLQTSSEAGDDYSDDSYLSEEHQGARDSATVLSSQATTAGGPGLHSLFVNARKRSRELPGQGKEEQLESEAMTPCSSNFPGEL